MPNVTQQSALNLALAKIARLEKQVRQLSAGQTAVVGAMKHNNANLDGFVRSAVTKMATPDLTRRLNNAAWAKRTDTVAQSRGRAHAEYQTNHKAVGELYSGLYDYFRDCNRMLNALRRAKELRAIALDPKNKFSAEDRKAAAKVEADCREEIVATIAELKGMCGELELPSVGKLIAALESPDAPFDFETVHVLWRQERDQLYDSVSRQHDDAREAAEFE